MFVEELGELSFGANNTFYSMHHTRELKFRFEIILSLGDQPERQSLNYIMGGNSKFSASFGHLGNIETIQLHLPSCKRCLRNM